MRHTHGYMKYSINRMPAESTAMWNPYGTAGCLMLCFLVLVMGAPLNAGAYLDNHNDGLISGWTKYGVRNWYETGGYLKPDTCSAINRKGYMINDYPCNSDGVYTFVVKGTGNTNSQDGGAVYRFTDTTHYYFVTIKEAAPGMQSSDNAVIVKTNSTDINSGTITTIKTNLDFTGLNSVYAIRIKLSGSTFTFWLRNSSGIFDSLGQFTDNQNTSGMVGYAYDDLTESAVSFDSSAWVDDKLYTWDISTANGFQVGQGTWGTNSYWSLDGVVLVPWPGAGNSALFSGSNGTTYTITINGTQDVDSIAFVNGGFMTTGGILNLGSKSGVYVDASQTITLQSVITGTGGLAKYGAGTLELSSNNTYTGATYVNAGTLQIGTGGSMGSISPSFPVYNNGVISINRSDDIVLNNSISGSGSLIKTGTGKLILTGNAAYSGVTTAYGPIQIGNGGSSGSLSTVSDIFNYSTVSFNRSDSVTVGNIISGYGKVEMNGSGTVVMSGITTYTGATNINAGKMLITGSTASASGVTVASGAVLGGTGTVGGMVMVNGILSPGTTGTGILTIGNSLVFGTGGNLAITLGGSNAGSGYDQIVMTSGTISLGSAILSLTLDHIPTIGYIYTIIDNLGSNSVNGTFSGYSQGTNVTASYNGTTYYFTISYTGGTGNDVTLTAINGATATGYTWDVSTASGIQTGSGIWGTNNSWTQNGGAGITLNTWPGAGNSATFAGNDTASGSFYSIAVSGTQTVDSIAFLSGGYWLSGGTALNFGAHNGIFVASGKNVVISTPVIGTAGLIKSGAGRLLLSGTSTYTGNITITAGALYVGVGAATGSISGNVVNNDSLVFNRSDNYTFNGLISGSGKVVKFGSGTLSLSGTNTYTGSTNVSDGTLLITGSTAAGSPVNVATGTILGGTGTAGGMVTVAGILSPGVSGPGNMSIGNGLTIANTGTLAVVLNGSSAGSGYNQVIVTSGTVTIDNAILSLSLGFAPSIGETFTIIENAGSNAITGTFSGCAEGAHLPLVYNSITYNFTISYMGGTGNDLVLSTVGPTHYTWDISASSGIQTGSGIWGSTGYFWTETDGDGTMLHSWPGTGHSATFGGTAGSYTITVEGTQGVDSVAFINSGYLITGGTAIDFGGKRSVYVAASKTATVAATIAGTAGLALSGGGTLILSGTNSYTGTTNVDAGILQIGTGGTTGLISGSNNIVNNGMIIINRSNAITFSGIISGTGQLVNAGTGTSTISGMNTYTGATVINGGALSVSSLGDGGSNSSIGKSTNSAANLQLDGGALIYTGIGNTCNRLFSVGTGGATVTASGTGPLILTNGGMIGFDGAAGNRTITLNGTNEGDNRFACQILDSAGVTSLVKSGTGTWILTGTTTFTGSTTINAGILKIGEGGTSGSIAGSSSIVNNGTLVLNRSDTTLVPGTISGTGSLVKNGTGTLVLTGINTFTGTTVITTGTLQVGAGGTTGALSNSSNILNNSMLVFNRSDAYSYGGAISGTGSVGMAGTGTVTLTGAHAYTGSTTIASGKLIVNGTIASAGALTVQSGGILGGTGTVGGAVEVHGTLAPGIAGTGVLSMEKGCSIESGGKLEVQISGTAAGTGYDRVIIGTSGTVTLSGAVLSVTLGYIPASGDAYTLIENNGSYPITGTFYGFEEGKIFESSYNSVSYRFQLSYTGGTGNDLVLTCLGAVVPENYNEWSHSIALQLNTTASGANVSGNVTHFPVLLRLTAANFPYFSQTLPGGADIRFAKRNGTPVPYEIERWVDAAGNDDTAEIWMSIDTVYGNNSTQSFLMYWGKADAIDHSNGGAVFTSTGGFRGVWHLDEEGNSSIGGYTDATPNTNYATGIGLSGASRSPGAIGMGQYLDGASAAILLPAAVPGGLGNFTASLWVKTAENDSGSTSLEHPSLLGFDVTGSGADDFELYSAKGKAGFLSGLNANTDNSWLSPQYINDNAWHLVAAVNNSATIKLYLDGTYISTGYDLIADGSALASQPLAIGAQYSIPDNVPRYFHEGYFDEVTVSATARSADWIRLCFENQKQAQTLVILPQHLIWDISVSAGIQAGNGSWGGDNYWTTDSITLAAWPAAAGNSATFAGIDGTYAISVDGTQYVDSISFEGDGYTLSGGTIHLGTKSGIRVAAGKGTIIGSAITGSAGLTKYGLGKLVLTAANSFSGPTVVREGTITVNGSLSTAVTVDSGATLGGNGSIGGTVTVSDSACLVPGYDGTGKLTVGGLVLDGAAILSFEIGTTADTIAIGGNLTLDGIVNVTGTTGFGAGTYTLLTYAGILTNNTIAIGTAPAGYSFTIDVSLYGTVRLVVTAVSRHEWVGSVDANWNTPGNWSSSVVPASTDSVLFSSAANPCNLDIDVTVGYLIFNSSYTQPFSMNGHTITVLRYLDLSSGGTISTTGNDTIRFDGPESHQFIPKTGILLPTIHQSGSGATDVTGGGLNAKNLFVTDGTFRLSGGYSATVTDTVRVAGGIIDFGSGNLYVQGFIDLSSAAALVSSSYGGLNISGTSRQIFYPGYKLHHPSIIYSGTDTLRVQKNRLLTNRLEITGGTVKMDTALTIDTVTVGSTSRLLLDTMATNIDTIDTLFGTGSLDFGKTDLHIASSLDMNTFATLEGSGRLTLFGSKNISLRPKSTFKLERVVKRGTGTVQVTAEGLRAKSLYLDEGSWEWNAVGTDTIDSLCTIAGGTMRLFGDTVRTGNFSSSGGVLRFNRGTLALFGSEASINLASLTAIYPDSGTMRFDSTGTIELYVNSSHTCPRIVIAGRTTDTVRFVANTAAKSLLVNGGILALGSGLTHSLDTVGATGGIIDFGSATISVSSGGAMLDGLTACVPENGTLMFTKANSMQQLAPPPSSSLPSIIKSGDGTLQLVTNDLNCHGLTITSGIFDCNARNMSVNGNLTVINGTAATITGIDAVTIDVSGNALFTGQHGNLLDLSPGTAYTLSVAGVLAADYTVIGKCDASGGVTGKATVNCVDEGGNANWTFASSDTMPPDNDMTLEAVALGTGAIQLRWNPSAVDSADRDSVGIWFKTSAYPAKAFDGSASHAGTFAITDSIQIIGGLSSHGCYYFAVSVRDVAGNWTPVNNARDSAWTFAPPLTAAAPLDIVHHRTVTLSWNNPSDLSPGDSIYIHSDSVPSIGWTLDTTLGYTVNSCVTTLPITHEGTCRVMISTSWDSSGIHHDQDVLIDTFMYQVDAPVITAPLESVTRQTVTLSFTEPAGLLSSDMIYVHLDTVGSTYNWKHSLTVARGTTTAEIVLPAAEGTYRYALSTSLDSIGVMDPLNRAVDTLLFAISPPLITTSADTVEQYTPTITWTAPSGMTAQDSFYIYIDTVTGIAGWQRYSGYGYSTRSTMLMFSQTGAYRYRLTTSWDSLASIETANGSIDTIVIIDTLPPSDAAIVISDNYGFTADHDPAITMSASGADSMRLALDADTAAAAWKAFAWRDSVDIAGDTGMKYIFVQFKDRAGNRTSWIGDSTVYDTTIPMGSIAIIDNDGFTNDSDPAIAIAGDGADSMRIGTAADTAAAVWKPVSAKDSVSITGGGNGRKYVYAQFKNLAGKYTVWIADSTVYDTTAPFGSMTIADVNGATGDTDPALTITASGADSMRLGRAADTAAAVWKAVAAIDSLDVSGGGEGMKYVFLQLGDRAGNHSAWIVDSTWYDMAPVPVTGLTVAALDCSTMVLRWRASVSADIDSVSINIADTGFAATPVDGMVVRRIRAGVVTDTLHGLPSTGYFAFVQTFVVDKTGNWSPPDTSAADAVQLPDCHSPDYALRVTVTAPGDTVVQVSIIADSLTERPHRLVFGTGRTPDAASAAVNEMAYRDTVVTTSPVTTPGWYYIATAAIDTAGNRSVFHIDSVRLDNIPPVITIDADTVIEEDTVWTATIRISDFNEDSVNVSVVQGPDSVRLEGRQLSWTPDDGDIGVNLLIIRAQDVRGGVTIDTFAVTVRNSEEPPIVTFAGDTVADEDVTWKMVLHVDDPDPFDHHVLTIGTAPVWVKWHGDTLYGTPEEADVGRDTLSCIVTDATGLRDTLQMMLTVKNRNDPPQLLLHTFPDTIFEKTVLPVTITVADPDRDDMLYLSWERELPWITIQEITGDTLTRRWTVSLLLHPGQDDTGRYSITLTGHDREGEQTSLTHAITVIDADDPPNPPVIVKRTAYGAVQYTVTSVDDYDTLLTYTVQLKSLSDTLRSQEETSSEGVFRFYPLDDGLYVLKVIVRDQANLSTAPVFDTLTISGASRMITGDTVWEMISVPGRYDISSLANTNYLLHWDESVEEKQIYHFYRQKQELSMVVPGKGYWRKGSGNDTIIIENNGKKPDPVTLTLHRKDQGWNQIASPYPYPVVWRYNNQTLWKWNTDKNDFDECDSVLDPWVGYWVQTDSLKSIVIDTVPFFAVKGLSKKKTVWFSGENDWAFKLALTSRKGNDVENRFGILPEAENGFDQLDRIEPPRISEGNSLFFPHTGWKSGLCRYAADVRKKWEPINLFEFAITGSAGGDDVALTIEGYEEGMPVYMFMVSGDSLLKIEPGESVLCKTTAALTYKTLFVVNNPAMVHALPLAFTMGNPYPNPFCPSTRIQYVLPYRWEKNGRLMTDDYHVSIDIYDLQGRKIRTCVSRKMKPGRYQVTWDGKSSSGRFASSGHYYCRLKADNFESIKKLVMMR